MQVLMRDLLDYGNPSIRGEVQPTSLAASVRRSVGDCQELARASGVELSAEIIADAKVTANPSRLARALENLIENAIQHSPQQGTVVIRLTKSGASCARLDVTDQGPGFPPQHMEKLFTPFFTLRPGGTGLGLTIAKKIVGDLGGAIRLSNGASGGARATVFLPMTPESTQELQPAFGERERGGQ
jgi:signal transduction histidine kinase